MLVNREDKKIKYLCTLINQKANETDNEKIYIGLENVEPKTSRLLINEDAPAEVDGQSNLFYKNNVLFSKLRPYLAKGFAADFEGRCSGEFLVLQTSDKISPNFLNYLMLSYHFIDNVNSSTYGAKMPRANWDYIGNMKVVVPAIGVQKSIVDLLNERTHKIDLMVEKKQKLIDLLQEKRQAIIDEAVTKGLNLEVPMKDSKIEWLGTIPVNWSINKIGRVYSIDMGKMNQSESKNSNDTYIRYLKSINTQWFKCDLKSEQYMWCNSIEINKIDVQPGDVLVCEGGEVGRACVVEEVPGKMIIEKSLHRVRSTEKAENKFLLYLLKCIAQNGWFDVLCNKSTIPHLTAEKLKQIRIPLPPLNEQKLIVNHLDEKMISIDLLVSKINHQIEKLQEYRQSLISEAVTGKIDVREYIEEVVQ
ncbi:restriction endonuclease subunit S [Paenibacillus filicis]|uniref:Restriction endonuclease subunit S n=1 Tax=Paenibacillus filicis TaxID=669464 RepID=A0ABU9DND6_9BACL